MNNRLTFILPCAFAVLFTFMGLGASIDGRGWFVAAAFNAFVGGLFLGLELTSPVEKQKVDTDSKNAQ